MGEVISRMRKVLFEVLKDNPEKRILVVTHSASMTFLLKSLCEMTADKEKNIVISFQGKVVYTGRVGYCETFKLEFDENFNLCSVRHIETDK